MNGKLLYIGAIVLGLCAWSPPLRARADDLDRDGVDERIDNCPGLSNPTQLDSDADGRGNACDADLNNDLRVDETDLKLFSAAQSTGDLAADLNGDGRIDEKDQAILDANLHRALEPSLLAPDPRFELAPPLATRVELFALAKPTSRGELSAVTVTFERSPGTSVSIVAEGYLLVLNDLGLEPDAKPGDGTFSGFLRESPEELRAGESQFRQRLQRLTASGDQPQVVTFSGREVIDRKPFAEPPHKQLDASVGLSAALQAQRVQSVLQSVQQLPATADHGHSLAIRDASVVAHPRFTFDACNVDGTGNHINPAVPWSFRTLMANMAAGSALSTQEFIHRWLVNWMANQTVNSFSIPGRPNIRDYFPGWDGVNARTLNIERLPFRLLAIMNRIDLAKVSYTGASGGEIRFVFGLVDPQTCNPVGTADRMTAIFEYGDVANTCSAIGQRARQWLALDGLALGSDRYMSALRAITDSVTRRNAAPLKPNGSALNQLRTNDFAFDGRGSFAGPWELREFVLTRLTPHLVPATIKQTPEPGPFRTGSTVTAQFMQQNSALILCERHEVPNLFRRRPFLGASTRYDPNTFWDAPTDPNALTPACWPGAFPGPLDPQQQLQSEVRHKFSLNTCDSCHTRETDTFFVHIDPADRAFSGFLTGITVDDPVVGLDIQREFSDLERRAQILEELATRRCGFGFLNSPVLLDSSLRRIVH